MLTLLLDFLLFRQGVEILKKYGVVSAAFEVSLISVRMVDFMLKLGKRDGLVLLFEG